MRRTFGGFGFTPPAIPTITVSSVWAGNVSATAATVKARSTNASSMTLRYSTDPGLAGYTTVAGSEGNDDVFSFALSGLSADTTYYYGFAGSDVAGRFRTITTGTYSFGIAAGSCAGPSGDFGVSPQQVSNARTFDKIADRLTSGNIVGFLHLGDRHYRDINVNDPPTYRGAYQDVMAQSRQLAMHQAGWVDYAWNDHDFGPDDSHAGSTGKPAAQSVYREHVPHWTLPESDSIHHTYVIGRVRFIVLDDRSYRSENSATDNASKTMLGATQKQWLKDTVNAATEPVIVLVTGSPWNGTLSYTWDKFSTERTELTDYFSSVGKTDKLLMLHGDHHFLAADDGTNAPGGIPTLCYAPLDEVFTPNDGTWSKGIFKSENQQYGTIHFTDSGSAITVTCRGYSVTTGGVETERFEMALTY